MPRVKMQTKSSAGATRTCGRCHREIKPGEKYYKWAFRYGGKHYRCMDHYPKRSELTQSKMGTIYAAIESAEEQMGSASVEEMESLVQEVVDAVQEVADEYREAAEPFQGQGENAERADELEGWISELEGYGPEAPDEDEFDEEGNEDEAKEKAEIEDLSLPEAMQALREEWEEQREEILQAARDEAQELFDNCPF